ncbi:AAA family ATPase [uncultured Anaerovibrio sp.]|uniref:AAA family ATPase n=1 Tax=uncultured Anaerovibrio sp. TaxID=361586 RepID=UPI0025F68AA8|nr:AAA family ATPase [uncultured Anaerovibrio sp.]
MNSPLFISKVGIDWGKINDYSYLRNIPAISSIDELEFHSPITLLAGENGMGKSTLLEAMAVAAGFNPEGGTKNYAFSTYDSHSDLCDAMRLIKSYRRTKWGYFLRAESFYNVATMENEYSKVGGVPEHFHEMSHGESFLRIADSQFKDNGLYFLDEPEAALSPQRQLALLRKIYLSVKGGSQFFIVTHSPILLGLPDSEILVFDGEGVHVSSYEETDSYQVTSLFINRREYMLEQLLGDEKE